MATNLFANATRQVFVIVGLDSTGAPSAVWNGAQFVESITQLQEYPDRITARTEMGRVMSMLPEQEMTVQALNVTYSA